VLLAKSTYVWLEQLSKKYGRHIHRLDHIPDEELRLLSERGITGLWLIGLWERSVASRTIKRLRGHHDAVASAYSLKEYNIAEDLGGNRAYEHLRDRAAHFGLRLASDMVPNHMGIDSPWVIEHPDWFVSRWESPFPSYSFNGPDLSTDPRVEIKIDDHYYDQTDAAVAFRVRHHADGATRYMYHGNDGTTFAWNDTAQLDYSKAYVREHVMQVILHVARLFPIIRFDAAMVLAKRHVQRLWFPLPGAGGSIPSRAENAMSQEEFDALMPHEFWREVVDRVAVEVPGTLLLAEAFWLLEGYFVRTLGMHRVYNSAFMNMLRDEENAKYRSYLKKTIEFDPDILKRYVNFMSNPDERTAIDQFGSEDKYFGVATMLATLPGLPMFGHGQIEGYTERYGMEYKTAKMEEWPNEWLVSRHMREIAPLLKSRYIFAESEHFVMYDLWTGYGTVNENVFAYSNRSGGQRALILYNNSYNSTDGTIHISVGFMDKGSGEMRQRGLADGLGVPWDDALILAYRDTASGLQYLKRAREVHEQGMYFALRGYQYTVLMDWRELHGSAEWPWDALCDELQGAGVPNLDEAIAKLRLRPVHLALRHALQAENILLFEKAVKAKTAVEKVSTPAVLKPIVDAATEFFNQAFAANTAAARGSWSAARVVQGKPMIAAEVFVHACDSELKAALKLAVEDTEDPSDDLQILPSIQMRGAVPLLALSMLRCLPWRGDKRELFDALQLRTALAESFEAAGIVGEDAWREATKVRLALTDWQKPLLDVIVTEHFWQEPDIRWLAGVNESEGHTWFNKESFRTLVLWLHTPSLADSLREGKKLQLEDSTQELEDIFARADEAKYDLDLFLNKPVEAKPIEAKPATESKPTTNAEVEEQAIASPPSTKVQQVRIDKRDATDK
jgi:hypothetical protein